MKQILLSLITFTTAILMILTSSSCKKNDEGPDRDDFIGFYSVIETCGSGNYNYDLEIQKSGVSEDGIIIRDLYFEDNNVAGSVDGSKVTIQSQLVNGTTYSGSGTFSNNTLTINFSVSKGGYSDNCNATCTKK